LPANVTGKLLLIAVNLHYRKKGGWAVCLPSEP